MPVTASVLRRVVYDEAQLIDAEAIAWTERAVLIRSASRLCSKMNKSVDAQQNILRPFTSTPQDNMTHGDCRISEAVSYA